MLSQSAYLCKQLDKQNQGAISSPPPTLKPHPLEIIQCSKCQGFGHSFSDCVNQEVVTLAEWTAMIEEETQEEGKKEKKSKEEEVTPPDEGEMLLQNRVSFGFQRIEKEDPKEDLIHIETSILSTPTIPSEVPHKSTQNHSVQPFLPTLNKPSVKNFPSFREWLHMKPLDWEVRPFEDAFFKWLILVFGLSTALIHYQD